MGFCTGAYPSNRPILSNAIPQSMLSYGPICSNRIPRPLTQKEKENMSTFRPHLHILYISVKFHFELEQDGKAKCPYWCLFRFCTKLWVLTWYIEMHLTTITCFDACHVFLIHFSFLQPCKHFACGSCLKGDDCPYDHELSKYECHNYKNNGMCIRGDRCKFSHVVRNWPNVFLPFPYLYLVFFWQPVK